MKKVVSMEVLKECLKILKKKGKKIVYAHGAFDLLHTGHIHHLEEAKKLGDVLVVTVTADKHIKRGPGRPRFNEAERARFLASLECVDYVAVSDSADAVSTIETLRPDIYVKGEDVKEYALNPEKGLYREIQALQSYGGEIKFLKSLPIHSTELLNEFFGVYPPDVRSFLEDFGQKYSTGKINDALEQIKKLKVLVIGDAIIDKYQYVSVMSKSLKSNHIVTSDMGEESFAGGVMACANHIAGFCGSVHMVTCLGNVNSHAEFIGERLKKNIQPVFVFRDGPTTLKRRFVEPAYMTKLFEDYSFNDADLSSASAEKVVSFLDGKIADYDLVLAADFGHGFLVKDITDVLCAKSKFLAINVQTNSANYGFNLVTKYPKADYICIDEPEIRLAAHNRTGKLEDLIKEISRKMKAGRISITRGHRGCMTFEKPKSFSQVPVLSTKVVDTVGAGDAFFSVSSPFAALGLPMEFVGFMGNIAGAIKVSTLCNKFSVQKEQFKEFLERLRSNR